MNKLVIVAVVLASLSCVIYAEQITVKIREGFNSGSNDRYESFEVDDEITVKDLAKQAMVSFGHGYKVDPNVRLENLFMIKYPMAKKLRQAGIGNGSKLVLKYWGRLEDLGANTLVRLIPLGRN